MYHEEPETRMKSISGMTDLFGSRVELNKNGKPLTERQSLMKYFCDRAEDRKGLMAPARVAFLLAGLSKGDLYAFKSILESETARQWPQEAGPAPAKSVRWNRIFWARLRPNETNSK